jgi:hypothetical protein
MILFLTGANPLLQELREIKSDRHLIHKNHPVYQMIKMYKIVILVKIFMFFLANLGYDKRNLFISV